MCIKVYRGLFEVYEEGIESIVSKACAHLSKSHRSCCYCGYCCYFCIFGCWSYSNQLAMIYHKMEWWREGGGGVA